MQKIANDFYNTYGDRWYTANDDPVALLRAESKTKTPWIINQIKSYQLLNSRTKVLDVGCVAGFLSNELSKVGLNVTGVDLSPNSLMIARKYDETKSVNYQTADAYHLPFPDHSFDILTAMDFLEHVEHPDTIIKEFSRVLKPNGLFIFHTFNRNFFSYVVIIKLVEWLVKNTPKNMHVINLFIKPQELVAYCLQVDLIVQEMIGIKPLFSTIPLKNFFTGIVPSSLKFKLTKTLLLSYMGIAQKGNS